MRYLIILLLVLLSSCSKEELICGNIQDGRIDYVNYMHYLRIDGKEHWVSEFTYNSYRAGEWVCLD